MKLCRSTNVAFCTEFVEPERSQSHHFEHVVFSAFLDMMEIASFEGCATPVLCTEDNSSEQKMPHIISVCFYICNIIFHRVQESSNNHFVTATAWQRSGKVACENSRADQQTGASCPWYVDQGLLHSIEVSIVICRN